MDNHVFNVPWNNERENCPYLPLEAQVTQELELCEPESTVPHPGHFQVPLAVAWSTGTAAF